MTDEMEKKLVERAREERAKAKEFDAVAEYQSASLCTGRAQAFEEMLEML